MYSPFNPEYEQILLDNLEKRANLLKNSVWDARLRECLKLECKNDPKFFFENFLYTVKNDTMFSDRLPYAIPFIPFDYQAEMIDLIWYAIVNRKSVFVEKSRQMSVTWLVMGLYLYGFLFHWHRYLNISKTADEVDKKGDINSCFGRLRFMLDFLPSFLLPIGFDKSDGGENNKFMAITSPDGPASITGESANPDAGRGGTYTSTFLDEMGFMKDATSINKACSSATPCRIMNSTPNGEGNEYYRMRTMALDQAKLPLEQRTIIAISLHWKLHPYYTDEWYAYHTSQKTKEQIEQELEINYNVSVKWRVYKRFALPPTGDVDIGDFPYDYTLPLYVSIDNSHWGADPHAAVVFQTDRNGNIVVIDSVQTELDITEMAHFMAKMPLQRELPNELLNFYDRWRTYKKAIFIWDPYDTNSTWNNTSIAEEYKKVGIILTVPNIIKGIDGNIPEQIRLTTQNLSRVKVNARCTDFISAMQNARYPETKEGSNATTQKMIPVHDWTSHYRTSFEYLMLFLLELEKDTGKKKQIIMREKANYITGEIEYVQV